MCTSRGAGNQSLDRFVKSIWGDSRFKHVLYHAFVPVPAGRSQQQCGTFTADNPNQFIGRDSRHERGDDDGGVGVDRVEDERAHVSGARRRFAFPSVRARTACMDIGTCIEKQPDHC
jgi:hypothetical protein